MHPESIRLAEAFAQHFWSADHEIRWGDLETEHSLWLNETTVLVGKIDATGTTSDGEPFFADWKTASKNKARYMDSEKAQWRMTPQALTYGVLLGGAYKRFMVRWALKTVPVACHFEWYTYADAELQFWRGQLIDIARRIRTLRNSATPWPLNLHNCTRYGETYRCPFRDEGCWKLKFDHVPSDMSPRTQSHLAIENELLAQEGMKAGAIKPEGGVVHNPDLVVLDASRVSDWMDCNEYYRRAWEQNGLTEISEPLIIGTDFHSLIAEHLTTIKETSCSTTPAT